MSSTTAEQRSSYAALGLLVVRRLVPPDLCDYFTRYLALLGTIGRLAADPHVAGAQGIHGDAAFDTLLDMARPSVAELVGRPLAPTYSYARLYRTGNALERHVDRGACEHSLTVHLGSEEDDDWPLWVRDRRGDDVSVSLETGDALLYQGRELEHWREPFTGRYHAQLFLHYVDAEGPEADLIYDGRPSLGS
jgi:hypothetical protein